MRRSEHCAGEEGGLERETRGGGSEMRGGRVGGWMEDGRKRKREKEEKDMKTTREEWGRPKSEASTKVTQFSSGV